MKGKKKSENFALGIGRTLRDFLTHTSSHGLKYLGEDDRSYFERGFWIAAILLGLSSAIFMVLNIYTRYTFSPFVMTLQQTSYPSWKIAFPAITLCNPNSVLTSRAKTLLQTLKLPVYMNETMALAAIQKLVIFNSPDIADSEVGSDLRDLLNINSLEAHQIMPKVAQTCEDLLEKCIWLGNVMNCDVLFKQQKTHLGFCCSFNYDPDGRDFLPVHSHLFGASAGLTVLVRPEKEPHLTSTLISHGLAVLIHDPFVYPDEHVIMKLVPYTTEVLIPVRNTARLCSDRIRKIPPKERNCLFRKDEHLSLFPTYLDDNCITECRINYTLRHCGCVPYFYPRKMADKVCDLDDVSCLYRIFDLIHTQKPSAEKIIEVEEHEAHRRAALHSTNAMTCTCPTQCEGILREARISWGQLHSFSNSFSPIFRNNAMKLNFTDRMLINVFVESELSYVVGNDISISSSNLLGLLGGIASLFLGCSFVTPIEFFYFLTVRLPGFLGKKEREGCSCPASPRAVHPERYVRDVKDLQKNEVEVLAYSHLRSIY